MKDTQKQRLMDGIEALYPADADCPRTAFIGQIMLHNALENAVFNWRDLPAPVLARYLAICEDYELQLNRNPDEAESFLPDYLNRNGNL